MSRCTIGPAATPEALHTIIEDGFNRYDVDAVVAAYEDDAVLISPGGALALGRNDIRAATVQRMALQPKMSLVLVKKVEGDETAVTHGHWRMAITTPDGNRREMTGRGTLVCRRRRDGSWGIVLDDLGVDRSFGAGHATNPVAKRHPSVPTAGTRPTATLRY